MCNACTRTSCSNEPYPQLRHKMKMAAIVIIIIIMELRMVGNACRSYNWGTLYRQPMGRLVLRYKKSKNLSGEAYIQSSNTNSPGIIKTSQKIERFSKTRALALDDCIICLT